MITNLLSISSKFYEQLSRRYVRAKKLLSQTVPRKKLSKILLYQKGSSIGTWTSSPRNGDNPDNRMYVRTPTDHRSVFCETGRQETISVKNWNSFYSVRKWNWQMEMFGRILRLLFIDQQHFKAKAIKISTCHRTISLSHFVYYIKFIILHCKFCLLQAQCTVWAARCSCLGNFNSGISTST